MKPGTVLVSCVALCLVSSSCLTLCDPMDCSPQGTSVCGDSPGRTLEWVAMPSSRGSSQPRDCTNVQSPTLQVDSFLSEPPGKSLTIRTLSIHGM